MPNQTLSDTTPLGNSHNTPFGRRAVLGGSDVKGNTQYGKEAEVYPHQMQALWQALLSQDQECVCPLRLWSHRQDSKVQMEQAFTFYGIRQVTRKVLSP